MSTLAARLVLIGCLATAACAPGAATLPPLVRGDPIDRTAARSPRPAPASTVAASTTAPRDALSARIQTLVDAIDQDPNPLHNDVTPAVVELGRLGPIAAPKVLDLLAAPDPLTRLHAARALELMASGYLQQRARAAATATSAANGVHTDQLANAADRATVAERWRGWLRSHLPERCVAVRLAAPPARGTFLGASPCPDAFGRAWQTSLRHAAEPLLANASSRDDYPLAVHALVEYGVEAGWAVVDLLEAPDATLRLRAEHVLVGVLERALLREAEERARAELATVGYDVDAAPAVRAAAIARWRALTTRLVAAAPPHATTE